MITAVLDTNVLASGFVRPEPPPGQLLVAWRARLFLLVTSEPILAELTRTFEEPYFAQHLNPSQRANNIALLRHEAIITPLTSRVQGVATHPEDDLVLATALSASVHYLVSGDNQLKKLGRYRGVIIVSPRGFLEVLSEQGTENSAD